MSDENYEAQVQVLMQMMHDMNGKLSHVSKTVEKNSDEIKQLRDQVAMGRGGLKVILWAGGVISAITAAVSLYFDQQ